MIKGIAAVFFLAHLTACTYSFFENPSNYPSGTSSSEFPAYDHFSARQISVKRIPTEVADEAFGLLEEMFLVQGSGMVKCTNVEVFQKFVNLYFNTSGGDSPQLQYLCLFESDKDNVELNWRLSDTPKLIWSLLPPYNLINTDIHVLRTIDVSVDSSIAMTITPTMIKIKFSGTTLNLSKAALADTGYGWIPEAFLSFDVDTVEIHNDGGYFVRVRLPLGIPYTLQGQFQNNVFRDNPMVIQGEKVFLTF